MKPYGIPLRFEPTVHPKPWGEERWHICDRPEAQSACAVPPAQGETLGSLLQQHPLEFLGENGKSGRFPLLVKTIDAREPLSLQVHPDDETAAAFGDEGKTEAWYVLHAQPDAKVYCGWKPGVTRARRQRALQQGRLIDLVEEIPVRPGDLVAVPPGTIHAIGPGVLLAEIQQNSDTTYRLWDWGRVGLDGKPRELHLEKGMRALDAASEKGGLLYRRSEDPNLSDEKTLYNGSKFRIDFLPVPSPQTVSPSGRWSCLGVVAGSGELRSPVAPLPYSPGDWFLLPAACPPFEIHPAAATECLFVREEKR